MDEAGARATIVDAEHALTTAAAIAPAGPHLAALIPLVPCTRSCSGDTGPPMPLVVHDVDRGTSYTIGTTTANALGFGNGGVGTSSVSWSSDGRWLFFPTQGAGGAAEVDAWREGLIAPIAIPIGPIADRLSRGAGTSVVFPVDTPMPDVAG